MAHLVEALRHNTEGPGLDSGHVPWGIFQPAFNSHGIHSASNRNEEQELSLWAKLRSSCAECNQSKYKSPTLDLPSESDLLWESFTFTTSQPYAPVAFTPQGRSLILISIRG